MERRKAKGSWWWMGERGKRGKGNSLNYNLDSHRLVGRPTDSSRGWNVQASGKLLGLVRIFKCSLKYSKNALRTNYQRGESLEREIVATRISEKATEIRRSRAGKTKEKKKIDEVRQAGDCDYLRLSLHIEIVVNVKVKVRHTEWPAYTPIFYRKLRYFFHL